jgi:hypothetical protein
MSVIFKQALAIMALAAVVGSGCGAGTPGDSNTLPFGATLLGPSGRPGYYILSGTVPSLDLFRYIGFVVSATGSGHYSISWINGNGGPEVFSGAITVDGQFDQQATVGHTGSEGLAFTAPNRLSFQSTPGNNLLGLEVVSTSDPIYVDALINQSHPGVAITLTGENGGTWSSEFDPVALAAQ